MVRGGATMWPLRLGLTAGCVALPWVAGPWYTAVMLLLLPILRALLDGFQERPTTWVCVAGGCVAGGFLLPEWLWPAVVLWCAGLLAMSILRVRPGKATIVSGAALAAAEAVMLLALLYGRCEGRIIPGLAQMAVDWVEGRSNSAEMLLMAYQTGLARLEGDLTLAPALRLFGTVVMPSEMRLQLLYSLRGTLEILLRSALPEWLVGWMLLTALVPALALEGCLRGRGRRSDLPPLGQWYLPGRYAVGAALMLMMGLLPLLTRSPVWACLGSLCGTLGYWALATQGASVLVSILTERGVSPVTCGAIILLGMTALPLILFLLGGYDQLCDPRLLRGSRNEMI